MKFTYNPEIRLDAILQILALILAVTTAYASLKITDAEHNQRITVAEKQIDELNKLHATTNSEIKQDIKELGKSVQTVDGKLTAYILSEATRNAKPNR